MDMIASTALVPDVLVHFNSPQAALKVYDALVFCGTHASSWRACASRLRRAAAEAHPSFRQKYLDRAVDCDARALKLEVRS